MGENEILVVIIFVGGNMKLQRGDMMYGLLLFGVGVMFMVVMVVV